MSNQEQHGALLEAEKAKVNWRKKGRRWLEELARAVEIRHESAGEVAFQLEPDLKEGWGGLRDMATEFGIERTPEDVGQTLGVWGVPPYGLSGSSFQVRPSWAIHCLTIRSSRLWKLMMASRPPSLRRRRHWGSAASICSNS